MPRTPYRAADGAIYHEDMGTGFLFTVNPPNLAVQVAYALNAAAAAVAYDAAIQQCADSPEKMASFCTAQGDDLDALYAHWINLARQA
jgi:hypothetical protein